MTPRLSALCGLLAPVAFTLGWLLGGLAQPDRFSFVRDDISDLGALTANRPWLYNQIGGNLAGLLVLVFAVGLWRALPEGRAGRIGVTALAVSGVGQFLDGVFRLDCRTIDPQCHDRLASWHGVAHGVETVVTFASLFVAMFALSRAFGWLPEWSDLSMPSMVAGIATVATLLGLMRVGAGLAVLVASTIFFVWVAVVAYRLLVLSTAEAASREAGSPSG